MEHAATALVELHADEIAVIIESLADPIAAVRELLAVEPTPDVRATLEARLDLLLRAQAEMVTARSRLPPGLPTDS